MNEDIPIPHDQTRKHETLVCKQCNTQFECRVGDIGNCQCTSVPIKKETRDFLAKTSWGCLCAQCLKELDETIASLEGQRFPAPGNLQKDFHYYIENGLWVFTGKYHILRGNCCKSGCRHCPYGFGK